MTGSGERGTPTESGDPLDSPEGLAEFVSALLGQPHDYDSSARAAMQAAVMAFNLVAGRLGLTGFQGSWAALNAYSEIMGYRCEIRRGGPGSFTADDVRDRLLSGEVMWASQIGSVRSRLSQLAHDGLVEHVGITEGRYGSDVFTWMLTGEGHRWLDGES